LDFAEKIEPCKINWPNKIPAKAGIQELAAKYDLPELIENLPPNALGFFQHCMEEMAPSGQHAR